MIEEDCHLNIQILATRNQLFRIFRVFGESNNYNVYFRRIEIFGSRSFRGIENFRGIVTFGETIFMKNEF